MAMKFCKASSIDEIESSFANFKSHVEVQRSMSHWRENAPFYSTSVGTPGCQQTSKDGYPELSHVSAAFILSVSIP